MDLKVGGGVAVGQAVWEGRGSYLGAAARAWGGRRVGYIFRTKSQAK